MRPFRIPQLLIPFALLGALAAVGGADDARPDAKGPIKLPGQATGGVVSGDHFYTIADSRLLDVDLKERRVKRIDNLEAALRPYLDVADGKACVAAEAGLFVIDLSSGQSSRPALYKGEVHGLGFAGENRVFVLGGADVVVLDMASGETVKSISIAAKDEPRRHGALPGMSACQKVGKLLYVADNPGMCVRVVDLEAGKVLDEMTGGYDWYTGVQVVGDKAFVRGINLSYGINNPVFGCFDLKTKKYTNLKHPHGDTRDRIDEKAFDDVTLVAGPDAGVCLAWKGTVYQYDAEGRQVGETPLAKDDDGRLVGVWNGQALTAGKDGLRLTPLAKATATKSD